MLTVTLIESRAELQDQASPRVAAIIISHDRQDNSSQVVNTRDPQLRGMQPPRHQKEISSIFCPGVAEIKQIKIFATILVASFSIYTHRKSTLLCIGMGSALTAAMAIEQQDLPLLASSLYGVQNTLEYTAAGLSCLLGGIAGVARGSIGCRSRPLSNATK
jgi:hypothetical protein